MHGNRPTSLHDDLIIRNGTAADFTDLEMCCGRVKETESLEEFEYWDGVFHKCVAKASRNNFLLRVFDLMNEVENVRNEEFLKSVSLEWCKMIRICIAL